MPRVVSGTSCAKLVPYVPFRTQMSWNTPDEAANLPNTFGSAPEKPDYTPLRRVPHATIMNERLPTIRPLAWATATSTRHCRRAIPSHAIAARRRYLQKMPSCCELAKGFLWLNDGRTTASEANNSGPTQTAERLTSIGWNAIISAS